MAGIIKKQILKHLSRFTKNLSPDKINLSTLKGEGQLTNLELDEEVLQNVLDLPTWLAITRVYCNKAAIRIQWTKLKTHPISLYLDKVEVEMRTCEEPRQPNGPSPIALAAGQSEYGFAEKVVEGMFIIINSITIKIQAKAFHASFELWQLQGCSMNPKWQQSDLRFTRITDPHRGEVLTFKELTWQTLRIEADAIESAEQEFVSTPLRLITNQGRIRIALKRRVKDCNVVATKLMFLLDDLLWVFTDSQLKAMMKYAKSLSEAMEKSAQQRKSMAPDTAQSASSVSSMHQSWSQQSVTSGSPSSISQYFEEHDVKESSYHLSISRLDLHICEDSYSRDPAWTGAPQHRVTGGAIQLTFKKMGFDYYPFHLAGDGCRHWVRHSEAMETRGQWAKELLKEFGCKVEVFFTQTAAGSGEPRRQPTESVVENLFSPEAGGRKQRSASFASVQSWQSLRSRLRSSCVLLRVDDLDVYQVSTPGQQSKKPTALLSCCRKSLRLPENVSAIHIEFTEYYFPDSQECPVPCPNLYIQLNGLQFTLDEVSMLWMNLFSLDLYQSLQQFKAIYKLEDSGKGDEHIDIRLDGARLKFVVPVEKKVVDHPNRPQSIAGHVLTMTATNSRHAPHCTHVDLQSMFRSFASSEFYHSTYTQFPRSEDSFNILHTLFLHHAYHVDTKLQKPSLFPHQALKSSAANDIWSIHFTQLSLDFEGAQKSKGKSLHFIEEFPLSLWICLPVKLKQSKSPVQQQSPLAPDCKMASSASYTSHMNHIGPTETSPRSKTIEDLRNVDKFATSVDCGPTENSAWSLELESSADVHVLVHTTAHVKIRLNHYQYLLLLRLKESLAQLGEELAHDIQAVMGSPSVNPTSCLGILFHSAEVALLFHPLPTSDMEAKPTDSESTSLMESDLSPSDSKEALVTEEKGLKQMASPDQVSASHEKVLEDSIIENVDLSLMASGSENQEEKGPVEEACEAVETLDSEEAITPSPVTSLLPLSPSLTLHPLRSREPSLMGQADLIPLKNIEVELTSALNTTKDVTKEALHVTMDLTKEAVSLTKDAFSLSKEKMASTMQRMLSLQPGKELTPRIQETSFASTPLSNKVRILNMNRAVSQQSIDAASLDGNQLEDQLSVDSDSSENFVILQDSESITESLLSEHVPHSLDVPIRRQSQLMEVEGDDRTSPDITSSTSQSTDEVSQEMALVLVLKLLEVNCGIDTRGEDMVVAVRALEVIPEQLGNVGVQQFLNSSRLSPGKPFSESKPSRLQEAVSLRFEAGPSAAAHSPLAVKNGFLHFCISNYSADLLMSSLTSLGPFLEDEVDPEVIPMKIEIRDTQITLKDDGPRLYPTSPGPIPIILSVDDLTVQRTDDGTFCIKAVQMAKEFPAKETQKQSLSLKELEPTEPETVPENLLSFQVLKQNEVLQKEVESLKEALTKANLDKNQLLQELWKYNPNFHL
uniref:Bridge-like lipid transfer protein family member 3A n=1 Tax=Latimeria chalumnae TaxID=7897 RepID=H3B1B9_LATCH